MKYNRKYLYTLVTLLLIIESCAVFLMYKSLNSSKYEISNLENKIINRPIFALMLEQSDGTYSETSATKWPSSGYVYNYEKSNCIDLNGNVIEDILTYDPLSKTASVDTTKTSYCYLYFDLPPDNLYELCKNYGNIDECIKSESGNLSYVSGMWDSTLEDDGYRYVGYNPNNYVCFGTTNLNTCINNTDLYVYRIIGIFKDADGNEHLKLIKKEALEETYQWHSSDAESIDWYESDLYAGINGDYYLNNNVYSYLQDNNWEEKISTWNYTLTNTATVENYVTNSVYGPSYRYTSSQAVYLHEMNRNAKTNQTCYYQTGIDNIVSDCSVGEWKNYSAKIGLMYVSDFLLSGGYNHLNYTSYSNASTLNVGWMFLPKNDSSNLSTSNTNPPSNHEWTMSIEGCSYYGNLCSAWRIVSGDAVTSYYYNGTYSVRPVFYVVPSIKITGGIGTLDNPYVIS